MKTIKHILSEMNNLQGELYQQLIRVINETVGDGVLRVFEDGGLHMNAYEFDYELGQYVEKNIFALAVFDGQLAIFDIEQETVKDGQCTLGVDDTADSLQMAIKCCAGYDKSHSFYIFIVTFLRGFTYSYKSNINCSGCQKK